MTRVVTIALLATTALLLASCADDTAGDGPTAEPTAVRTGGPSVGNAEATPSTGPTASAPVPEPGTTVAPATEAVASDLDVGAPEGWQTWQVDRMVFALPEELVPSVDRTIPSASVSFFSPLNAAGETVSGAAVFVETGAVGPLEIRTQLLEQVRADQTGTEPVRGPEPVDVPGSAGATRVDHAYELTVAETDREAASLQVDLTIQMPDPGPQYAAFLNATTDEVSEADLTAFVESFRVLDPQGELPG